MTEETKVADGASSGVSDSTQLLAAFAVDFLRHMQDADNDFWGQEESEPICEILMRHGLMGRVAYSPDKHGQINGAEPGDEIWAFTNLALVAANAAVKPRRSED